jgi:hypothetical protein
VGREKSKIKFMMQMYMREKKYKNDFDDLEQLCKNFFYILEARF